MTPEIVFRSATKRYAHRVAFNADLIFDIVTDSPDTSCLVLEQMAMATLQSMDPKACVADIGFDVPGLEGGRVYPRVIHEPNQCSTETDRLEHFTSQDCSEVKEN